MIISAAQNPSAEPQTLGQLLSDLGPSGVVVLIAIGAFLLLWLIGKSARKALAKAAGKAIVKAAKAFVRYVTISLWAARMRMPIRLAIRLQPDRWAEMTAARKLLGLKRGKVRRTPMGVDIRVTFGGSLTLESVTARIKDLETGLGTRRGAIRVEPGTSAHKGVVRITVRNPLAKNVPYPMPTGLVSIKHPAPLSMNPFGEWTAIDLQQRILIVGASGSGKSSAQRVMATPVILAADADLEVWDLKQGTESQHYEGKADVRITNAEQAKARLAWFMEQELPRRAAVMQAKRTSTWPTSMENRDRIVMVDEGAALIRELDDDELARFFTFLEQARAFGIYLWWATQFPKGTNLPTELRSQMSAVVALKMRRQSESRVVFEDLTKEGWTPHRLPGKGWLLLLDDEHQDPEESRAAFIDEKQFRRLQPYTAAPAPQAPAPAAPVVPPMPTYAPSLPEWGSLADPGPEPFPFFEPRIPDPRITAAMDEAIGLTKEAAAPVPPAAPQPVELVELSVVDAIRTALADAPESGMSAAELIVATGRGKSQVYAGLQELTDDEAAVKVGRGRYVLAGRKEASA
ncbi:FtsK/SpoIIIE domain-containing protein [Streptomyces sp. IBSNAI002]|uniref:FtsK/SpoIIIE domain-containing protein n=1 Tax=Streptomyces sp. IBSNAI002 TaxID=3457500 RepID=UPI003FCF7F83